MANGTPPRRIYRSRQDKVIGGVCGGVAEYLNVDPIVVRLALIIGCFISFGTLFVIYLIAWAIIPLSPPTDKSVAPLDERLDK